MLHLPDPGADPGRYGGRVVCRDLNFMLSLFSMKVKIKSYAFSGACDLLE